MARRVFFGVLVVILAVVGGNIIFADEGMWTLNNLPLKQLKDDYNFVPTPEWVEHIQKSSARSDNCSLSFNSASGLLMTNWHCSEDAVKALSTPRHNYYENGFYARTLGQELKTNLNVRILISMADVTQRVNDAVLNDTTGNPAKVRQETIISIQRDKVGLSATDMLSVGGPALSGKDPFLCEVIVLYQGGQYQNYCYRIYDDIRLVFMPERSVGFFGGDADNFEYPRYTLDVSFLRAYENGKPAQIGHYFKWSKSGAAVGELIFSSGHPGRTARLLTASALRTERDVRVPFLLDLFRRRELTTQQFMLRGKNQKQTGESDLFGWQNSRKLYVGKIKGLQDPVLTDEKEYWESETSVTSKDPSVLQQLEEGRKLVAEAQGTIREIYPRYSLLVRGFGFDSRLYGYATSIVSGNQAFAKAVLEARVSEAPINLEYEVAKLTDSLTHLVEVFSWDDPLLFNLSSGSSPSVLAHDVIYGTALKDINQHKAIVDGAPRIQVVDPMIELARIIKVRGESYAKTMNGAVEKERHGYTKVNDALFKIYGTGRYPDATFTLRLSFGFTQSYYPNGNWIRPWTTIGDAFRHSAEFGNAGDYKLPARWYGRKGRVNLKTPLNFISNLDITGGNSGSPVINQAGEIVGLIFDSNINSLVSDYDYNYAPEARAIAVHSAGIIEILSKIYRADRLVLELTGK